MKRVLRVASVIIGIPLALFVTWFAMAQYEDWRYIHPWESIQRGDTEEQVVKTMGRPHRVVSEHSTYAPWASAHKIEENQVESVKQFGYIPFSITGEEYRVGFDASGHAVLKYHITSP